jgi:hypothetical protein
VPTVTVPAPDQPRDRKRRAKVRSGEPGPATTRCRRRFRGHRGARRGSFGKSCHVGATSRR